MQQSFIPSILDKFGNNLIQIILNVDIQFNVSSNVKEPNLVSLIALSRLDPLLDFSIILSLGTITHAFDVTVDSDVVDDTCQKKPICLT